MKYLTLILFILLPSLLSAEKAWVQKHYIQYEECTTLECPDSNNCFAFTDGVGKTIIYKSTDQGNTWFIQYQKDNFILDDSVYQVYRCQALDSEYIYISFSDRAVIDKSTDGGKTFERVTFGDISSLKNQGIIDLKMYNRKVGVAISWSYLFLTRSNWETYEVIDLGDNYGAGEPIFWIDSVNVAMINKQRYDNDFKKFNINIHEFEPYSERVPPDSSKYNLIITDVVFVNDTVGFASGGQEIGQNDLHYDLVFKTTNRGKNWELIFKERKDLAYGLTYIDFENESHGMAVGEAGKILEIFDGGKTFKYHENLDNIKGTMGAVIAWAGSHPIFACQRAGIFRYEETTDNVYFEPEQRSIRVRQAEDAVYFSIDVVRNKPYKLIITDIFGKTVYKIEYTPGYDRGIITVPTNEWANGTYFYAFTSGGRAVKTGKLVVVR